ncbi:pleiotropic drug resistance protein 1-like [Magnolia sinica]|uniref:pleiotropic drug resistance protein 1-like n=1 Tax=Magnolia sinica TaxID=86752 RepID=UPI002658FDA8|nr:pleiotropic drug resistance protein 1-like [Magnolia sinica]
MAGSMRVAEGMEAFRAGSLRSASKHMFQRSESVFVTSASTRRSNDDEEDLKWAALEKLPTYNRLTLSLIKLEQSKSGRLVHDQVDVRSIGLEARQELLNRIVPIAEQDNEYFVQKLRDRIDSVGITLPEVEVRFEHLSINAEVYVGGRAMPTLLNSTMNTLESVLSCFMPFKSNKKPVNILKDVSGIIKPGRMTLLLGPPGSGKTTLLLALAGKLDKDLKVLGRVTYNGCTMNEFVPQRTSAYISQHDLHIGDMTVRETLDFSARCQGVGNRYDVLTELSRREKDQSIKPDPDIDFFMKAVALEGQRASIVTDYTLKLLGLDVCADTMVGDDMRRGISGGQKKRVTTGEMIVGPSTALFMDEISTGLDSSTTFQIVKCLKHIVHIFQSTMVISLLQPAPETFNLFDDVILICEGQVVYHGPRDSILEFFEMMGFRCPERKGAADFLQEVTSRKDQYQYWFDKKKPYHYIPVDEFYKAFQSFHVGKDLYSELIIPYEKSKGHPAALVRKRYGLPKKELFKACFDREVLLMKRSAFIYIFKAIQIMMIAVITMTVFLRTEMDHKSPEDGSKYMGVLFFGLVNIMFNGLAELQMTIMRLPVFYKQRDAMFFPAWAFALATFIMRIPVSLLESSVWVILTYYTVGLAPSIGRFLRQLLLMFNLHQMSLSLFRFIAALGRSQVVASTFGAFALLVVFVLGGFVVSREDIYSWWLWGYWSSPLMYAQNAIAGNEFLAERWKEGGKELLKLRGIFTEEKWYWIGIGALVGYNVLFNILFTLALEYLSPLDKPQVAITEIDQVSDDGQTKRDVQDCGKSNGTENKGMVLPFKPLSMEFDDVKYFVDMPEEMKQQGEALDRLQLLQGVSGSFRPGVLTCLMGVSGAGKTTLMDVLAGRKTGGYIEGSITISGYPKNQETFARVSGYCEQNDIHSPNLTVHESLIYSAWLRLPADVDIQRREMFVNEVMDLVELNNLKGALVGVLGVSGLSTEQRKRLTIAVELVANPSIIFMDEPTSGLDARAAAIVMRTVRNTVNTGRTVVCTIHQPSIDIFESFDELLLMKRGGQVIYAGPLGKHSQELIDYFEEVEGVPKITPGYNPATWMLEASSIASENRLGVEFAEIYLQSSLYQKNKAMIEELKQPVPGSEDIHFETKFSQPFWVQAKACLWKQNWSYWRNPQYNVVRFVFTLMCALLFSTIFWDMGSKIEKQQDFLNAMGSMFSAVLFLGVNNAASVQPVVDIERSVFYRERAAGMFSALPYALAQMVVELPYVFVQSVMYGVIVYSTIGFHWTVAKFLWFFFFMFFTFLYYTYYGMMTVALTPNAPFAAIVSSAFYGIWMLFSGFLIPRTSIPVWWRWYYWGCPVSWTLYGLVTTQFGDITTPMITYAGTKVALKDFLSTSFGFDRDMLPLVASVTVGFALLFAFVFAFSIRTLNFQTR